MQEIPISSTNLNPVEYRVELVATGNRQECELLMKAISDFKLAKRRIKDVNSR